MRLATESIRLVSGRAEKMPRKVAGSNPARGSTLQVRSTLFERNRQFDISTFKATGERAFENVDNRSPKPKALKEFGTWAQAAGAFVFDVRLATTTGLEVRATLMLVCHARFASFRQTTSSEGITVDASGTTFNTLSTGVSVTFIDLLCLS